MSKATKRLRRAGIGGLTAAVALGTMVASAGGASAVSGFSFTHVGGDTRYDTAAAIAEATFPSANTVLLANGNNGRFPDALSGNYLAGLLGAPVLLTDTNSTPKATLDALKALGAKKVILLGDSAVISNAQSAQLATMFSVSRLGGDNRYDTNKAVVESQGAGVVGSVNGKRTAIVATGENFPDALGAGPLAFANHLPVILTQGKALSDQAKQALQDLNIQQVIIVGGTDVVSAGVQGSIESMGLTTLVRFAGTDRSDTSKQVADWEIANAGFSNAHFSLATGAADHGGVDALAGGVHAGSVKYPLLITNSGLDAGSVVAFAKANASTLVNGLIYGDAGAVSDTLAAPIAQAAGADSAAIQAYSTSPSAKASLPYSIADDTTTTVDESKQGNRTYTVTGLDDTKTNYNVALVEASNITVKNGVATFTVTGGVADFGSPSAEITSVQNVPDTYNQEADGFAPVNGVLKFTVDSATTDDVVPVVWLDADNGGDLDLNGSAQPTEKYTVGGETEWVAIPAAANGSLNAATIDAVDKSANTITVGGVVYSYDANDNFANDANTPPAVTMADFESQLSVGDEITATYYTSSALSSSWTLTDNTPSAPSVDVVTGSNNNVADVQITPDVADATYGSQLSFVIQRAPVVNGTVGTYATISTIKVADDADDDATAVDYFDKGLAVGNYSYRVATVLSGEQSVYSSEVPFEATAPVTPDTTAPSIAGAAANEVNNGVGEAGTILIDWNENATLVGTPSVTIKQGAITFTGTVTGGSGTQEWVVTLDNSKTLQDAPSDVVYTVTVPKGAAKDAANNVTNSALNATFSY